MTITEHQVFPSVDEPGIDQRPGSTDITWTDGAYHHQRRQPANERRRTRRALRRRTRILGATLAIVLLVTGLVVAMRFEGSSAPLVVHRPTSSQTATATRPVTGQLHFSLAPTLLRPFPSLFPTIDTSKR